MPSPGIEPATLCFPACPSNHSAIGLMTTCELNFYSTYLRNDTTRTLCTVQRDI